MLRILAIIFLSFPALVQGQYKIKVNVTVPAKPIAETIYAAGNFNEWNPKDENAKFVKGADGKFYFEANEVQAGSIEFKFTRGSWENVESTTEGKEIANRSFTISSDTILNFSVAGWKDAFTAVDKKHTASKNVQVIDTAFAIPQLNRNRKIWVYLPAGYDLATDKYPVLYMHDGQNLFDVYTGYSGEWGVDEALDSLQPKCIVIGIDNGADKRMNEYNPSDNERFGKGEGKQYLEFLVKTLKPFVDKKYRTLPGKKYTSVAGSSMGGLISFYAGLYYPQVFGSIGVFSPSFWITPKIKEEVKQLSKSKTHGYQQYYFYVGAKEGDGMVDNMLLIETTIKETAAPRIQSVINPEGKHNELAWRNEFPVFYKWIMKQ